MFTYVCPIRSFVVTLVICAKTAKHQTNFSDVQFHRKIWQQIWRHSEGVTLSGLKCKYRSSSNKKLRTASVVLSWCSLLDDISREIIC